MTDQSVAQRGIAIDQFEQLGVRQHLKILLSYKTYPHVDMRKTGAHAAQILDRAMRDEIAPRTVRAHAPMLDEANSGRTDTPETLALYERAREAEGLLAVSVNSGFTGADVVCVGPTVLTTYDSHNPEAEVAARHRAEELADQIWQGRTKKRTIFIDVDEAASDALAWRGTQPLVIADYADNPGAGSYGDSTALLKGFTRCGGQRCGVRPDDRRQGSGRTALSQARRNREGDVGRQG
ncbi:M81 family metallopeptidase [Phyllobacterium sp. K27]